MGSGAIIYIPSFIKIGSDTQKPIGEIRTHAHTGSQSVQSETEAVERESLLVEGWEAQEPPLL
jgi:hypothetical protein